MVDQDIEELRKALDAALGFALDASGEIERVVRMREADAYFYGIPLAWKEKTLDLVGRLKKLKAEIVRTRVSVCVIVEDLNGPLDDAEEAIEALRAAIQDVESARAARPAWERLRDETRNAIDDLRAGRSTSATCAVCGHTFFENPSVLAEHFRHGHPAPDPQVKLFIPVERQWGAIVQASAAMREAFEVAVAQLTRVREGWYAEGLNRSKVGKPEHLWRDVLKAKFLERRAQSKILESQTAEAVALLAWARSSELPQHEGRPEPAESTVREWIRDDWQKGD